MIVATAQTLINSMLDGDQGLRAYLSDGSGYNKTRFVRSGGDPKKKDDAADPLSWLQLPKLYFVEVAGQEVETTAVVTEEMEASVVRKLGGLAERLRSEMNEDEKEKAKNTVLELESLMSKYGFEYENTR